MQTILHKAATRGHADHGWLNTHHTFSFAGYHDPERVRFGVLRVLNDDWVKGGKGFGTHPHDNMEIITIPLEGALEHQDSMGNKGVIHKGAIQVMSAGTGIQHSEYNHHADEAVSFLQIWLFPNKRNVTPRYAQLTMSLDEREGRFQQIISPNEADEGLWIHQNAWFHLGRFSEGAKEVYALKQKGNGLYVFVISGAVSVAGTRLETRDGMGIWDTDRVAFDILAEGTEELLMDVPMDLH